MAIKREAATERNLPAWDGESLRDFCEAAYWNLGQGTLTAQLAPVVHGGKETWLISLTRLGSEGEARCHFVVDPDNPDAVLTIDHESAPTLERKLPSKRPAAL
jgi:hypothetical protein